MKKNLKYILIVILSVLIITSICIYSNNKTEPITIENKKQTQELITSLKKKYNNGDIKLYLEIPDVVSLPIVKTTNNNFYLTHDLYKHKKKIGTPFLDYRIKSINDKKLIIYGHNSTSKNIPFKSLTKYKEEDFYKKHPNIYIYTNNEKITYQVFSSYIEKEDFDYVNLNSYNGLTYYEHLLKLKNKSIYDTKVKVNKNSKIIILQTCSFEGGYDGSAKYHLVMGVKK